MNIFRIQNRSFLLKKTECLHVHNARVHLTFPLNEMYGYSRLCDRLRLYGNSSLCDRLRVLGALRNSAVLKAYSVVNWPYRLLFFGHQSVIRKITHKAVINNLKQCISNNPTWFFVCCNIHFQKYPMFLEKLFKYNRNRWFATNLEGHR